MGRKVVLTTILTVMLCIMMIPLTSASFYTNMRFGLEYLFYEDFTRYSSIDSIMSIWSYYKTVDGTIELTPDGLLVGYESSNSYQRFKILSPEFDYDPSVGVTLFALVKTGTSYEHDLEVFFYLGDGYYTGIGAHGWSDRIRWYYVDKDGRWYDKDFSPGVSLRTNTWYLFVVRLKDNEVKYEVYLWNNGQPQIIGVGSLSKQTPKLSKLRITLGAHNDGYKPPFQWGIYKKIIVIRGFDKSVDIVLPILESQNSVDVSKLFLWKYFTPRTTLPLLRYSIIESSDGSSQSFVFTKYVHTIRIHNNLNYDVDGYQVPVTITQLDVGDSFIWSCEGCIKIVDENGVEVPYYIEEWDPIGKVAKLLVKVDLKANTDTTLTLYSSVKYSNKSNPYAVFDLYDDFESQSLNQNVWKIIGINSNYAVSNTVVEDGYVKMYTNGGYWVVLISKPLFHPTQEYGYRLEFSYSIKGDVGYQGTAFLGFAEPYISNYVTYMLWALKPSIDNVGFGEGWCRDWGLCFETCNDGSRTGEFSGVSMSSSAVYYTYNATIDWYVDRVRLWFVRSGREYMKEYTTNIPDENLAVWFGIDDDSLCCGGVTLKIYWVRVRKVLPIEPEVTVS